MSTINRGPLGSAFLINRDPASTNNNAGGGGGAATAFAPEPSNPAKAPAASSTAIPMPGPTLPTDNAESSRPPSPAMSNFAPRARCRSHRRAGRW